MDSPQRSTSGLSDLQSPAETYTPDTDASVGYEENLRTFLENLQFEEQYILVTGGLGFIGSHTTLELLKANYNVIVVDNMSNSYQEVFDRVHLLASRYHESRGSRMPSLQIHNHDFQDCVMLRALLKQFELSTRWEPPRSKISGVIHFAAHKSVEESIRQPLKYYSNNVTGLVNFVSILEEFGIKNFIFSSSATVYGTAANSGAPLREEYCVHSKETFHEENGDERAVESGCVGITNPYGRTKWMCEAILADLAASDPSWTVVALRYFNPIGCDPSGLLGEDPRGTPTNLLPVVVNVITGQIPELKVFGDDWDTIDGTAVRDFIHVTDLARGHIAALSTALKGELQTNFRTFNLGTGYGHSVMEVVNVMESVSSRNIPRKAVSRRQGDVGSCVAVAKRSDQELHWRTEKSLQDACADTWNFLKLNRTV
ncbi:UDP-glucose 4-epimerase GalE [Polytolypa hystricis UAMH7299]|uniref:UDP-glucose 4-epimerase GalE n=1 Tax=Polytolypa hystricis (strain UAMH7299) TaxID=1447883 RepID=A0A2B7Y8K5_POLH7|nr:UDP-glucose 4-epimerase GalE [Polytolypa hystricis UAMH7299]